MRKVSGKILYTVCHFITTFALLTFAIYAYIHNVYPGFINYKYFGWIPLSAMVIADFMRPLGKWFMTNFFGYMIFENVNLNMHKAGNFN